MVNVCLFSQELEESFCLQSTWFSFYFGGLSFGRMCTLGIGAEGKGVSRWRALRGSGEDPGERGTEGELATRAGFKGRRTRVALGQDTILVGPKCSKFFHIFH